MDEVDPLGSDLNPTAETQQRDYDEVTTNHLSPMGQVEEIGRFVRAVGPNRMTTIVRAAIVGGLALIGVLAVVSLVG